MSIVTVLVDVLGPVVALVVLGAISGSRLGVDGRTLSRLAYWILGPAFMFDVLADADLEWTTMLQLGGAGLAGMGVSALVALAVLSLSGVRGSLVSAGALTAAYGNVGNAGLAICVFAFGDEALPVAGVFMLAINVTGMMLGVALATSRQGSIGSAVARAMIAPMTVASVAALGANAINVARPALLDRSVGLLAGALIPVMLYTLGVQLRRSGRFRVGRVTVVATGAKLVVAPLAAVAVARGLGLVGDLVAVTAVQSAMPPAVFCMVVAMEHDFETAAVTATVAFATIASLLTLPIVLLMVT